MNFPVNLKYLRKRYDFSQERLAILLNRSKSAVSNWENGINNPDFDSLIILRELFKTDIETLLFGNTDDVFRKTESLEKINELNEPPAVYGTAGYTEGLLENLQRRVNELEKIVERLNTEK